MTIHYLETTQWVAWDKNKVWRFFSNPHNLSLLTPPSLRFKVVGSTPETIYPGLMIEYRVSPFRAFKMQWLTEITHVREGEYFVDEQRTGPYRLWHHEHFFRPVDKGIEIHERVTYQLPFGILGNFFHPFLVQPKLKEIFSYREKKLLHLRSDVKSLN